MSGKHSVIFVLCLVSILTLLGGCSPVQRSLDRRLRTIVEDPHAPLASLAVVVVADNNIVYESYWGRRTIDEDDPRANQPLSAVTKFRVASISKVATALAAMQLVEEGKLVLDTDVGHYLGFALRNPSYPKRPITARMLLSHTSSLRDAGLYTLPLPYTLQDLFVPAGAYYANGAHFAPPERGEDRGPGAYFGYANLNYGVLATVMEAITGERFDRYMVRRLFAPLNIDGGFSLGSLSDTGIDQLATLYSKQDAQGLWDPQGPWYAQADDYRGVRPRPVPPGMDGRSPTAVVRHKAGREAPNPAPAYAPGTNATQFAPHSGLRISARDLAKLLLLFLNQGRFGKHQIVAPATVRNMLHEEWRFDRRRWNGDTFYGRYRAWGLGLQHTTATEDDMGGDRMAADSEARFWGHRGEAYGLLGGMWFDPQRGVGFVYLIGGIGDDPYIHPGAYSSAYSWEEALQTAILGEIDRWEEAR